MRMHPRRTPTRPPPVTRPPPDRQVDQLAPVAACPCPPILTRHRLPDRPAGQATHATGPPPPIPDPPLSPRPPCPYTLGDLAQPPASPAATDQAAHRALRPARGALFGQPPKAGRRRPEAPSFPPHPPGRHPVTPAGQAVPPATDYPIWSAPFLSLCVAVSLCRVAVPRPHPPPIRRPDRP